MADKIAELQKKIKTAKDLGEEELVAKYENELAKLTGGAPASSGGDFVIPGITEEEYESAGSKFANAGCHMSEFGMPYWKTPGMSIAFPFTIVDGPDKNKNGEIAAGVGKNAVWKLREILTALNVTIGKDKTGNIKFDPSEVAGKRGQTIWTLQKDTRPAEEGGKGGTYTKPTSVIAEDAAPPVDIT